MIKLNNALKHWGTEEFAQTLKHEIETLDRGSLPLEHATAQGGIVDDSNISALINHFTEDETSIQIKVGIFFHEIIAGCNCADDPVAENSYCELLLSINKVTAETDVSLLH